MEYKELFKAAFDGDLTTVQNAIEEGTDVNLVASNGMNLLIFAIWQNGNPHVVEYLLEKGADPTYRQPSTLWNALVYAAVNGHAEVLQILLDRGQELDEEAGDWKALMYAVTYRNHRTAEMLLQAGANINVRDPEQRTPLMRAAKNSDVEMVRMLLQFNPELDAQDENGMTALIYAAGKAKHENVEQLLNAGADPTLKNSADETAHDLAIAKNRKKMIALLEAHGEE